MTAIVAAIGAHLRKPAPSRRALNSSLAKNGMPMAIPEKGPTTFRQSQTKSMLIRVGLAGRIFLRLDGVAGARLRKRAPSRGLLDSKVRANGRPIAVPGKGPPIFRSILTGSMPMRAGSIGPTGL